jgi:hypothetical protein
MTKTAWYDLGAADAKAGHENSKPRSGWQLNAYTLGWQEQHDEMATAAASKAAYVKRTKEPMFDAKAVKEAVFVPRRVRDATRRCEATVAKMARRAEQRKLRARTAGIDQPRGAYVSPNTKRGGMYR